MEICRLPIQPAVINLRQGQTTGIYSIKTPPFPPYIKCSLGDESRTKNLDSKNRMFILGMGSVGKFLAADLKSNGWEVTGTCTSTARKKKLEEMGLHAHIFDTNEPQFPPSPTNELAKARIAAEEGWLHLACDERVTSQIFRLDGIYGPGRSAVDTILKQDPLSKGQKMRFAAHYTSRIHVADICQALKAGIQRPSPGKIYNVVDDDPAPREQVFNFARNLVEEKWPRYLTSNSSAEEAKSLILQGTSSGEKRVSSKRIKTELGVRLLYPTYKSGLRSIIERIENPFRQS